MTNISDDQLTPEEAAAFAALPRTAADDELAERRTVQTLRERGLLQPRAAGGSRRGLTVGLGIAAALLLFAAGTLFGRRLAAREAQTSSPSLQVQQAGTAYVNAMVRLTNSTAAEHAPGLVAGLEAGTATLRAAATSLALLTPNDPTVRRIRASLDAATDSRDDALHTTGDRPVIWF